MDNVLKEKQDYENSVNTAGPNTKEYIAPDKRQKTNGSTNT